MGNFVNPLGIAIVKDKIFVTDAGTNNVKVFERQTGKFAGLFGDEGDKNGSFNNPNGISVLLELEEEKRENEIFVVDQFNNRVQVFDINGNFRRLFGNNFLRPHSISIDNTAGRVYVSDFNTIKIFSIDGTLISSKKKNYKAIYASHNLFFYYDGDWLNVDNNRQLCYIGPGLIGLTYRHETNELFYTVRNQVHVVDATNGKRIRSFGEGIEDAREIAVSKGEVFVVDNNKKTVTVFRHKFF